VSTNPHHDDPAFAVMTLDLLVKVLIRAEHPDELGEFLTEEIRELSGARCVVFIECLNCEAEKKHRVISVNPRRCSTWADSTAAHRLYEIIHQLPAARLWRPGEPSAAGEILRADGFELSQAVPLKVGAVPVGAMLLLGLPDETHLDSTMCVLDALSSILALVLRNAFLYEKQEQLVRERTRELQAANDSLRESERALKKAQQIGCLGSWEWDIAGGRLTWSDELYRIWGVAKDFAITQDNLVSLIHPDDRAANAAMVAEMLESGADVRFEFRIVRADGAPRTLLQIVEVSRDAAGKATHIAGIMQDITERKQAEAEREKLEGQLLQARKMEAVGQLAGGVAHDFNNMLQTVLGTTELLLSATAPDDPRTTDLNEIMNAARHSADLTRQLLAFARKQTIAPKVLDLNDTVGDMLKMLRRLIGEDIELLWKPGAGLDLIKMDPSQLDQILANLAVNARDAIAGVGNLTIETGNAEIHADYSHSPPEVLPGAYVMLAVSDDGCGMTPETQARIFEPFFTTKAFGQGTGLGLATVYGIVKQNNGFITVDSEPGQGTTFKIYLPRHTATAVKTTETAIPAEMPTGRETVLLVEDEVPLLHLACRLLVSLGYTVLSADSPGQALRLAGEYAGDIHLLMTDVVMPGMSGRDLCKQLNATRPGMKCLFMSGYTADVIAHRGVLDEGLQYIQKPFLKKSLAKKLREALAAAAVSPPNF